MSATPVVRAIALVHSPEDAQVVRVAVALGETTVIAVAPDSADGLLRAAGVAGAVRAVRLWDAGLETTDYLGMAFTLAATVRVVTRELAEPTVVVCGDGGRATLGPAVAERLSLPHLGHVLGAAFESDRLIVRRRIDAVVRMYAGRPPLVLCVLPVGAPLAPIASDFPVEAWQLSQAALTPAELEYRRRFRPHHRPGPERVPRLFATAEKLAERLRADGLDGAGGGGA